MKSANKKILVSCDLEQKEFIEMNGNKLKMAVLFEKNYREKSPVLAIAQQSKGEIKQNDILLVHHNTFYQPSPYWIKDDIFSIPYGKTIYGIIKMGGCIKPICTNIFVERVFKESLFPLPPESRETYIDRSVVLDGGISKYKKGVLLFHKPHAGYDIVFIYKYV